MLPPPDDPRWRQLVLGDIDFQSDFLPLMLFMSRIEIALSTDKNEDTVRALAEEMYDFFKRNKTFLRKETKLIFG